MRITKAFIAAGGYGTRFLPATKVIPKEMLPLVDKPIIQYLVEEVANSGIKDIIIVTRPQTPLIQKHFDRNLTLERYLGKQGKKEILASLKKISKLANITFIEQDPHLPYGNGSPLVAAESKIKKGEYFVLLFGDDLVKAKIPATAQLLNLWQKNKNAVILACAKINKAESRKWGIVKLKRGSKSEVEAFVEKPVPEEAPSDLGSFGRFILNREIIDLLITRKNNLPKGRELCHADAINEYCQEKRVMAVKIDGEWLTTGDPLNWQKANIEFALDRKEFSDLKDYLKQKWSK